MKKQLDKVQHDYIRYANCWEDADVLFEALEIQTGDRILSIGSAGDNSFSLLTGSPDFVLAVDVNPVQLQLVELKKAAFKALSYDEFLDFLGFTSSSDRLRLFEKVKTHLSEIDQNFWEQRIEIIQSGIIYSGKFENYFRLFRKWILPLVHSKKTVHELFMEKKEDEQLAFYNNKWNNRRWKLLFKLFFSKFIMGIFGRDPAFLKEVEVPVGTFIFNQAEKHLSSVECQKNYFLHFIMLGKFGTELPHYARKENFELIKKNIDKLEIFCGFAEDAFKVYSDFNKFNLSNIFEYMDQEQFKAVCENLIANARPNARFTYWNLMVPRRMSKVSDLVMIEDSKSTDLTKKDKGFFYNGICLNVKS